MSYDTPTVEKQQTILMRSEEINERLYELKSFLAKRFDRNPDGTTGESIKAQSDSVLDDILANQSLAFEFIGDLSAVLLRELEKIS